MRLRYWVVDAFAERPLTGNPAGVCVLGDWLDDGLMCAIAAENRLSETAFCVRRDDGTYDLRWFTPRAEIDLCGHATFGTAYVLFRTGEKNADEIVFHAPMAGHRLVCRRVGDRTEMDFPRIVPTPAPPELAGPVAAACGAEPTELLVTERDVVAVFADEATVRDLRPDTAAVERLEHGLSLYVTAPAAGYDYVARAFWPKLGIPEDPVCGSMQSALVPYWSGRLGRAELTCFEPSERTGTVWCRDCGDSVRISGHGALYLEGTIEVG
ncbi:PhzF family phenazine biosynthesis protein [Olsenella profusa]|uniref:PhzF family phenazine biosynthesis protein n=1 Tax=Olsenella profusa TaxID=138595 RepID=A0ABS2EZN6_9ACTN|nr:PhzF family phenazine biosynthesis protein [Olsenella profusa]MBM6774186.1 PhzF family phenazine biosynthesis protein [Olsenella profusa]